MRSILITGCNRGIGLELVRKLARSPNAPEKIFATCRDINKAKQLQELAKETNNIHIIEIDVTETTNFDRVVAKVDEHVGKGGLNVLINNAGISTKFSRLGLVKEKDLIEVFRVNTVAPIMFTKALLPLLKRAAATATDKTICLSRAAVVNITSELGSITNNASGGFYPYRCSKAALNIATKSMSVDLKDDGILVVCIHPGWVKTDMGGPNAKITVEESVTEMLNTLQSLTAKDTGSFFNYLGETIAW